MCRQRAGRRAGLTLFEAVLLLVLGVVVLGLVVMGLRTSRERAARLHCTNHLRQVGEGFLVYQNGQDHPALPPSRIAARYATWAVLIAPYLPLQDQENPLKDWDLQRDYYAQPERVRAAQLALYYCPARRTPQLSVRGDVPVDGVPDRDKNYPGALGDFACASGDDDPAHPWRTPEANGAVIPAQVLERAGGRILKWRGLVTVAGLSRGQAYTITVGEKHVPPKAFGQADQGDGSLYNGDYPASSARIGGPGHGLARSPTDPVNTNFGSAHPGICNFLYADGHVEPLATSISEEVLGRLLRRRE